MGHLNGGQAIAQRLKKNPDSWFEMKSVLPLMSQPEYYERLKSGRARGGEAVILVENVRSYYNLLTHLEPAHVPLLSITSRSKSPSAQLSVGAGNTLVKTNQGEGFQAPPLSRSAPPK
jgi:membrane-bound lytic murein transglycosylase F